MEISRDEMESRVESIIGDYIRGTELYWGHLYGRGVEVKRKNDNTLAVDLDLAKESWCKDPEVDVDFDLRLSCDKGKISMEVKNSDVDVDYNFFFDLLSMSIVDLVSDKIADKISASLKKITYTSSTGIPICPKIKVQDNGNVKFSF